MKRYIFENVLDDIEEVSIQNPYDDSEEMNLVLYFFTNSLQRTYDMEQTFNKIELLNEFVIHAVENHISIDNYKNPFYVFSGDYIEYYPENTPIVNTKRLSDGTPVRFEHSHKPVNPLYIDYHSDERIKCYIQISVRISSLNELMRMLRGLIRSLDGSIRKTYGNR